MTDHPRRTFLQTVGATALALQTSTSWAAPVKIGVADLVAGNVRVIDGAVTRPLAQGSAIVQGQTILTDTASEAHIVFEDGGYLAVRANSAVRIDEARMAGGADDILAMSLLKGALRSISGWVGKLDRSQYSMRTSTATVGIRGTDYELALVDDGDEADDEEAGVHHWVNEGATTLRAQEGDVDVEPGQAAFLGRRSRQAVLRMNKPKFWRRLLSEHEARVEAHGARVKDIIEKRLRAKGLLKRGETLQDAIERHPRVKAKLERLQERHRALHTHDKR